MINALISLLAKKGYCYFSGSTNTTTGILSFFFSTLSHERGKTVDITIDENKDSANVVSMQYNPKYETKFGPNKESQYIIVEKKNIPLNELILVLDELLKE